MSHVDILIIGAGPTGLTAAIEAARHGLSVRIIEQRAERSTFSKALVLHARTLEVFETMGCVQPMLEAGQRFRALNIHTSPRHAQRVDLIERSWGDTRYPFWLSVPQYVTEAILEEHLSGLGVAIEWSTQLTTLEDIGDHVNATLVCAEGESVQRAQYVLGCDGGRSTTREQVGITLEREDAGVTFALADAFTRTDLIEDEGHVFLTAAGPLLIVPMPEPGLFRLIAQVPDDREGPLDDAFWNALVRERSGLEIDAHDLAWSSQFRLHNGVAERFRAGRVFLLGDAAHIHSPVGGQGLNTGVQDAHNLVWKLAHANREALIDTYEKERQGTARRMVGSTARATRLMTTQNKLARFALRWTARLALKSSRVQDRLGRGVGMLDLLTDGAPRLPNPELPDGRRLHDLVDPLEPTRLTVEGRDVLVRPDRIIAQPHIERSLSC